LVGVSGLLVAVGLSPCPYVGQRNPKEEWLRFADIDICEPPAIDTEVWPQQLRQVRQVCVYSPVGVHLEPQLPMPNLLHGNLVGGVHGLGEANVGVEPDPLQVPP
jgi:hypothetical protein